MLPKKENKKIVVSKKQKWRLLDTGYQNAYTNMAIDEAISIACSKKLVPPTIRFYRWKPAAISLGYFQKINRAINIQNCLKLGLDIVRRPTGGRTVLHDQEITYSLVSPIDNPLLPNNFLSCYQLIGKALRMGLNNLNIKAELTPRKKIPSERIHREKSSNCFFTLSPYEILVNGKKIVGSAQKREKGNLLQHGSILLEINAEKLSAVLQIPPKNRNAFVNSLKKRVTSINELGNYRYPDIKKAIIKGFQLVMDIKLETDKLTDYEISLANRLSKEKYSSEKWNYNHLS